MSLLLQCPACGSPDVWELKETLCEIIDIEDGEFVYGHEKRLETLCMRFFCRDCGENFEEFQEDKYPIKEAK